MKNNFLQRKNLKNQKGQMAIEAILIMTMTLGFLLYSLNKIKESDYMENLVGRPYKMLAAMIETGQWKVKNYQKLHPNNLDSHNSTRGDLP